MTSTDESHLHQLHNRELEIDDISDLPLPELPPKKNKKSSSSSRKTDSCSSNSEELQQPQHQQQQQQQPETQPAAATEPTNSNNDEIPASQPQIVEETAASTLPEKDDANVKDTIKKQQRRLSLENSNKKFQEHLDKIEAKLNAKKMHYYNMNYGGNGHVPILSNHHNNNNNNGTHSKPTYLFGCNQPSSTASSATVAKKNHSNDEIFLNTSGWVQVNTKRSPRSTNNDSFKNTIRVIEIGNTHGGPGSGRSSKHQQQHSQVYSIPKITASKIEELISRNEARRYHQSANRNSYSFKPGYKILDPQISAMLNDRPGFLPVKNFKPQSNSPPPMTPILSPPPAFQDNTTKLKAKTKNFRDNSEECEVCIAAAAGSNNSAAGGNNKGMVFSRSFEYDNRRIPNESYVDTFSRSFDCNLSDNPPKMTLKTPNAPLVTSPRKMHRERSPNFRSNATTSTSTTPSTVAITGSTNASSASAVTSAIRDNSPKQNKDSSPIYMVPNGKRLEKSKSIHERSSRLRKSQLTKLNSHHHDRSQPQQNHYAQVASVSRFRSFDAGNQRLNSCDSGARSGEFVAFFIYYYIF